MTLFFFTADWLYVKHLHSAQWLTSHVMLIRSLKPLKLALTNLIVPPSPSKLCIFFARENTIYRLFSRWMCETNTKHLGKLPSRVPV